MWLRLWLKGLLFRAGALVATFKRALRFLKSFISASPRSVARMSPQESRGLGGFLESRVWWWVVCQEGPQDSPESG